MDLYRIDTGFYVYLKLVLTNLVKVNETWGYWEKPPKGEVTAFAEIILEAGFPLSCEILTF